MEKVIITVDFVPCTKWNRFLNWLFRFDRICVILDQNIAPKRKKILNAELFPVIAFSKYTHELYMCSRTWKICPKFLSTRYFSSVYIPVRLNRNWTFFFCWCQICLNRVRSVQTHNSLFYPHLLHYGGAVYSVRKFEAQTRFIGFKLLLFWWCYSLLMPS